MAGGHGRERAPIFRFLLFALVCLVFAGWLVVTLGNITPGAERVAYVARFSDATGLLDNDDVKISGVTVGKITGIDLDDGGSALITFTVDEDIAIPADSIIDIRWRDVLGLRFLYVVPGESDTIVQGNSEGVDFPDDQTRAPSSIGTFLLRATPFIESLDPSLQNEVIRALQGSIVGREAEIREIVSDAADLTSSLASRDVELGRLLDNSAEILDAYARQDDNIRALVDSLVSVSETLARRNDTLDTSVTALADLQEELGTLVEANVDDLRLALDALEVTAQTLATNTDKLDTALTYIPNIIAYHRVSRIGQWFNVRGVGVSANYQPLSAERGAHLPPKTHTYEEAERAQGQSNAASLFVAPLGPAGVR